MVTGDRFGADRIDHSADRELKLTAQGRMQMVTEARFYLEDNINRKVEIERLIAISK